MPRLALYLPLNALATTGMIVGVTISAIAAERLLGSATWSGLPVAASILGTALGSRCLAFGIRRLGIRWALVGQYSVAIVGGSAAAFAIVQGSFLLLTTALVLFGVSNGATQYVRYLAADDFSPQRRAAALSWVVWMGSFGAIVGPSLLAPSGRLALRLGIEEEAGPYLVASLCFALVTLGYLAFLRHQPPPQAPLASVPVPALPFPPAARAALVAMIVGHVVMVLIMTMTPIHLTTRGHGLGGVGVVLSSHTAGMFLFSPLVGMVTSRIGSATTLRLGSVVLVFSCVLAAWMSGAHESGAGHWSLPLFLLGLGWNIGFVAGSAQLSASLPEHDRLRGRAVADSWIWVAAALASLCSSLLFAGVGFAWLSALGAVLSLLLVGFLIRSSAHATNRPGVAH